jgi:MFS family permease
MSLLKNSILITKRGFLINAIFFFNFFTLYFFISFHIPQQVIPSVDNRLVAQTLLQLTIATTSLLTSFFINRINKLRLIYVSSIAISITTVLLFCVSNEVLKIAIILATGIFFSTAMLASFTYFWNLTVPEERGRVAGLIGSVSLPFYFIVDYLVAPALDFLGTAVLGIILSSGPIVIILLRPEKTVFTAKKAERGNYPEKRTVILYSIPWILFSLINSTLAKNISLNILQQISSSFYLSLIILQGIGAIFGATCGGIIADFFGRRLSLAFSLTLYGISSALAGLTKVTEILTIVYVANGLSWGILLILYTFVVWGDLANKENCAKMYSIGLITLYLTIGVGFLPTPISQIPLIVSSLASCLLIFLSNMPLVLAPELLSSDFRERMKLKLYANVIRKIRKQPQN